MTLHASGLVMGDDLAPAVEGDDLRNDARLLGQLAQGRGFQRFAGFHQSARQAENLVVGRIAARAQQYASSAKNRCAGA